MSSSIEVQKLLDEDFDPAPSVELSESIRSSRSGTGEHPLQRAGTIQLDQGPAKEPVKLKDEIEFAEGTDPTCEYEYTGKYANYTGYGLNFAARRWEDQRQRSIPTPMNNILHCMLLCPLPGFVEYATNPYTRTCPRPISLRDALKAAEVAPEHIRLKKRKASFREEAIVEDGPKPTKQILFEQTAINGKLAKDKAGPVAMYMGVIPNDKYQLTSDVGIQEFYRYMYDCADVMDEELGDIIRELNDGGDYVDVNFMEMLLTIFGSDQIPVAEYKYMKKEMPTTPTEIQKYLRETRGCDEYLTKLGVSPSAIAAATDAK